LWNGTEDVCGAAAQTPVKIASGHRSSTENGSEEEDMYCKKKFGCQRKRAVAEVSTVSSPRLLRRQQMQGCSPTATRTAERLLAGELGPVFSLRRDLNNCSGADVATVFKALLECESVHMLSIGRNDALAVSTQLAELLVKVLQRGFIWACDWGELHFSKAVMDIIMSGLVCPSTGAPRTNLAFVFLDVHCGIPADTVALLKRLTHERRMLDKGIDADRTHAPWLQVDRTFGWIMRSENLTRCFWRPYQEGEFWRRAGFFCPKVSKPKDALKKWVNPAVQSLGEAFHRGDMDAATLARAFPQGPASSHSKCKVLCRSLSKGGLEFTNVKGEEIRIVLSGRKINKHVDGRLTLEGIISWTVMEVSRSYAFRDANQCLTGNFKPEEDIKAIKKWRDLAFEAIGRGNQPASSSTDHGKRRSEMDVPQQPPERGQPLQRLATRPIRRIVKAFRDDGGDRSPSASINPRLETRRVNARRLDRKTPDNLVPFECREQAGNCGIVHPLLGLVHADVQRDARPRPLPPMPLKRRRAEATKDSEESSVEELDLSRQASAEQTSARQRKSAQTAQSRSTTQSRRSKRWKREFDKAADKAVDVHVDSGGTENPSIDLTKSTRFSCRHD